MLVGYINIIAKCMMQIILSIYFCKTCVLLNCIKWSYVNIIFLIVSGVFLGVSSNTRYQVINGLERLVEASPLGKRVPAASLAFTVSVRFANNVYGGMQFVDWARMSGCQWGVLHPCFSWWVQFYLFTYACTAFSNTVVLSLHAVMGRNLAYEQFIVNRSILFILWLSANVIYCYCSYHPYWCCMWSAVW